MGPGTVWGLMMMGLLKLLALNLLFATPSFAARSVMEGLSSTGGSIYVSTIEPRVGISSAVPSMTLDVGGDINFSGALFRNGVPFTSGMGTFVLKSGDTMTGQLTLDRSSIAFVNGGSIENVGEIKFADGGSYSTSFQAGVQDSIISYTLPTSTSATASGPKFLQLTEDGGMSWQDPPVTEQQAYYFTAALATPSPYWLATSSIPATTSASTRTVTASASGIIISTFITQVGYPSSLLIPSGEWDVHAHANVSAVLGNLEARIYAGMYIYRGSSEILIGYTEDTDQIGTSIDDFDIHLSTGEIALQSGDRIVVRLFTHVSGGEAAPLLSVYIMDAYYSKLRLPAPSVDVTNFVPYSGATQNVTLGAYNITAGNYYGNGSTLSNIITSTAAILTELNAIKVSTGAETAARILADSQIYAALSSTASALTAETARAIARENAIGASTGTINSDLQAYKTTVQLSTASIYTALNSTAAALTAETAARIARDFELIPSSAQGIYPLSISGNAATATSANSATNAGYATSAGTAVSAITATNLAGGLANAIPFQIDTDVTGFITDGSTGQVLTHNGASMPSWKTLTIPTPAGDNLGNHTSTETLKLNVSPFIRFATGGGTYLGAQAFLDGGLGGLHLYDYDTGQFDNVIALKLGGTYGPLLYGKTSGTSGFLGINQSAPAHTLSVFGGGLVTSSMTAASFYDTGSTTDLLTMIQNLGASTGTIQTSLSNVILSTAPLQYSPYFITSAGTSGQVWKSDGSGAGVWGADTDTDIYWTGTATNLVAATARTSLGLVIGTNVQAYDAQLDTLSGISSNITAAEVDYLDGVTSAIQTQFGAKVPYTGATGPISMGDTYGITAASVSIHDHSAVFGEAILSMESPVAPRIDLKPESSGQGSEIRFYDGGASTYWKLWHPTGRIGLYGTSNNLVQSWGDNGDVGIGVYSPAYKLDVLGGGHFTSSVTVDTTFYAEEICLNGDCQTAWPEGGTGGSGSPVFNVNNFYANTNGSQTAFYLSSSPVSNSVSLTKNGVMMVSPADYSIAGTTITMVTAPASSTTLVARYVTGFSTETVASITASNNNWTGTNTLTADTTLSGGVVGNTTFETTTATTTFSGWVDIGLTAAASSCSNSETCDALCPAGTLAISGGCVGTYSGPTYRSGFLTNRTGWSCAHYPFAGLAFTATAICARVK